MLKESLNIHLINVNMIILPWELHVMGTLEMVAEVTEVWINSPSGIFWFCSNHPRAQVPTEHFTPTERELRGLTGQLKPGKHVCTCFNLTKTRIILTGCRQYYLHKTEAIQIQRSTLCFPQVVNLFREVFANLGNTSGAACAGIRCTRAYL